MWRLIFALILAMAAFFRFYGLNWDQGFHLHPDERAIVITATNLRFPDNLNPKFFAYGSLPFYLLKFAGFLGNFFDPSLGQYQNINLVGRLLSGLFDLGTLIFVFLIAKKISGVKVAILTAFFYAASVLPIQLSHFYAVDTPLTFFATASLYFLVISQHKLSLSWALATGISIGLAAATKISAVILFVPVGLVVLLSLRHKIWKIFHWFVILLVSSVLAFIISEPFAILDFSTFKLHLAQQQAMTKDPFVFPYTLQYVGKIPYFYELKNIFFWGLGPIVALLSFVGVIWTSIKLLQNSIHRRDHLILLSFLGIYFLIVGKFAIGFMRYLLPIYPLLVFYAACLTGIIARRFRFNQLIGLLVLMILIWPISFLKIYSLPNSRYTTSLWINQNLPAGAKIAREHWDDGLPLFANKSYVFLELPLYDVDTAGKWEKINRTLAQADYIIVASHRLYLPLMRLTDCDKLPANRCYRQTSRYYQKLFNGKLEFAKVAEFAVQPTIPLINWQIDDFWADESFTVYDHPKVMIFQKIKLYENRF